MTRGRAERDQFLMQVPFVASPVLAAALVGSSQVLCVLLTSFAAMNAFGRFFRSVEPWYRGSPGAGGVLFRHALIGSLTALGVALSFFAKSVLAAPAIFGVFGLALLGGSLGFAFLAPVLTRPGRRPRRRG